MIQNMRSEEVSFIRSKTNEQTSDTKAQNMQRKHDFFQILSNKKSQLAILVVKIIQLPLLTKKET